MYECTYIYIYPYNEKNRILKIWKQIEPQGFCLPGEPQPDSKKRILEKDPKTCKIRKALFETNISYSFMNETILLLQVDNSDVFQLVIGGFLSEPVATPHLAATLCSLTVG